MITKYFGGPRWPPSFPILCFLLHDYRTLIIIRTGDGWAIRLFWTDDWLIDWLIVLGKGPSCGRIVNTKECAFKPDLRRLWGLDPWWSTWDYFMVWVLPSHALDITQNATWQDWYEINSFSFCWVVFCLLGLLIILVSTISAFWMSYSKH